jgi:hypothetical protein
MKIFDRQFFVTVGILAVVVYVLFGVYLYVNQRELVYIPDKVDMEECEAFTDYEMRKMNDTRFFYKDRSPDSAFVYYHGNAGSVCDRAITKATLENATDASMIYVEYSGYAKSDAEGPSRELILQDVRNIRQFLDERGFEQVTVYGQSLGSGAASYHASLGGVDRLVLVSAFYNARSVAQNTFLLWPVQWMLTERYPNHVWLDRYDGEIWFAHGNEDDVVSPDSSRALYEALNLENKTYQLFADVGHIDIWSSKDFRTALKDFLVN